MNPIEETLPSDSPVRGGSQTAWHAVVHLLVPCRDNHGNPVSTQAAAEDYISETLRGQFLDWGYVRATDLETDEPILGESGFQGPIPILVCDPYVEGSFLLEESS